MFSWHGKLLMLFSFGLRPCFVTFNRSPGVEWTVAAEEADSSSATAAPCPHAELSVTINTSDSHIGGIMLQKSGDHWRPLGFFSQ
jgi:hypothetical protein